MNHEPISPEVIKTIQERLKTPKGELPMHPDFGLTIDQHLKIEQKVFQELTNLFEEDLKRILHWFSVADGYCIFKEQDYTLATRMFNLLEETPPNHVLLGNKFKEDAPLKKFLKKKGVLEQFEFNFKSYENNRGKHLSEWFWDHKSDHLISDAFLYLPTPEGHMFWLKIAREFRGVLQ